MRCALLCLLLLACAAPRPPAPDPELLPRGPHPVGFAQHWVFDASQPYRTAFDGGVTYHGSRPLLVNLWYPGAKAGGAPMPRSGYLPVADDQRTTALAAALERYERGVIAAQVFGAAEAELAAAERAAFLAYLERPTGCVRDARPAGGPFPLVLHHSGAGSSYEDNAELCEHLASCGFVVLSAPFQQSDGGSLDVDAREGSAGDLEFFAAWARTLPFVGRGRIGAIGHSAGAQALLRFAARPAATPAGAAITALVLLDTTQHQNSTLDPRWSFVQPVRDGRNEVRQTLLFATVPHAFFELADELVHAERCYLTIAGLGHDDFIAQGIARARERARFDQGAGSAAGTSDLESAYRALCAAVVAFLASELGGDAEARAALARLEHNPIGGAAPRLERMPRGACAPPPFRAAQGRAPSPRQLRPVLCELGAAETRMLLERCHAGDGRNPVYTEEWFAYALLFELVQRGQTEAARELYVFYGALHPGLPGTIAAQVEAFARYGHLDYARRALATGRALEPGRPQWDELAAALGPGG